MQHPTDSQTSTSHTKPRRQITASQACDACRLRKVRCDLSEPRSHTPLLLLDTSGRTLSEEPGTSTFERRSTLPCRRCSKRGLQCSFSLPVGRRGPKGPRARPSSSGASRSSMSPLITQQDEIQMDLDTLGPFDHQHRRPVDSPLPNLQSLSPTQTCSLMHSSANIHHHIYPTSGTETNMGQGAGLHNSVTTPMSSNSHFSPHDIFTNLQYPTDDLCSRELLGRIIDDFLQYLYPLMPIIHRPTFRAAWGRNKDIHDKHFLSLLLAICAITVGEYPRLFRDYQHAPVPLRFRTRLEMVDYCYSLCTQLRGPRYFDEVSHSKWAISFLFYVAYFNVGQHNKSRMSETEAILFARLLEFHHISAYSGLNLIETQLRKKAFWLMFYGYVHLQLQNPRKERLAFIDCSILHDLDLEKLLPVPQDDEQISEVEYGAHNPERPSLAVGFILRSRLFWGAVANMTSKHRLSRNAVHCHCTRFRDPASYIEHLRSRLHELKYMLDSVPWYLRQWSSRSEDDITDEFGQPRSERERRIISSQFATLRADIYTTHLWVQSIIMDQIDAMSLAPETEPSASLSVVNLGPKCDWFAREDICRQMLLLLCSIPQTSLEANGLVLVYKVRDVAVSLLACPFTETDQTNDAVGSATRAKEYLGDFTEKLRQLDKSETINSITLQTWVDTDRNEAGRYYYW